ncbi:ribosome hibernation-promoting factor, HPF/YfiA family [Pectinatus brassicae]|uniref:Ribosome hibernation promoting factor n=1 Tax=Pectinatus brassicae TaxID=862415 RepID=A0A840UHB8_9FIRM|nr:ribosome-associated translation inhibitor RaiA [Pectinatus brassicae]MBB5335580.1 putative sigma-54 modulation protein [Pectinatus brassicae]
MATFIIRGKNIEITPALHDYVEKRVGKVTKYFDTVGEITVLLTVTKGRHIVEVTVPVEGVLLRGEESTMDMYTSIDLVIDKLERQIRKHKTKLARRFRNGNFRPDVSAPAAAAEEIDSSDDDEYPVVKTKRFAVKPMDVQEAIMQMNLINHEFFVFRDAKSEDVSVVYRRKDGNYGLIEPSR